MPTIVDLAGVAPEPTWGGVKPPAFPGRSLRPAFNRDPDRWPRTLFFAHSGNRALRSGDWKAVMRSYNDERWELYNLARDRAENHDLAADKPDILARLTAQWRQLRDRFEADRKHGS